jgi:omega-hydroxy-beta-dihydromenaquinone-9 sulfotransferase
LVKMLVRNKAGLKPVYLIKLFLLFHNSLWSSILARFEKIKYKSQIDADELPADMLIIVGHWRTGSTYLHNLLSKDENFTTPTLFHTAFPDSFLLSDKYIKPVMKLFVQKHRPMDKVELGVDLPQEDEYALIRMAVDTPLEKLIFPKDDKYFLQPDIIDNSGRWQEALTLFCKKLHIRYKKNILLKNPFHSFRIKELSEMFPQAKFICIHRHPFDVVPSTIKLWTLVGNDNNLRGRFKSPDVREVSDIYDKMYKKIDADFTTLTSERYYHIKYNDLESDPVNSVRKIYETLGYDYSQLFENNLITYIQSLGTYRKNEFDLKEEEKQHIISNLKDYMLSYGYKI